MRVLHTSDWHLGRTLHGYSRAPEHEAFLDEVVELCHDVDLVIVSGDVFETCNPPIEAEELFFDALARLGDGGRRAVVVIAGNHDSPDRLKAAAPLAARHGVWLFGRPGDVPVVPSGGALHSVNLVAAGPSSITLEIPVRRTVGTRGSVQRSQRAVVSALPYPSEARLGQLLWPTLEEEDRQRAYNRRIQAAFEHLAADFSPGAVNLATSHLAVRSCMPRSSERTLVGGAYQIEGSALPATAQYVALGHLHLPQAVPDAPCMARYAGAPIAMRFSESDDPRVHTLLDISPGEAPRLETIPVSAGRSLVRWHAQSVEEVCSEVEAGAHAGAFIDLTISVDEHLSHDTLAMLKALPRDIVRIQAELPESSVAPLRTGAQRRDLPVEDLFRSFFQEQTGTEPDTALIDLFTEIAGPGHGAQRTTATDRTSAGDRQTNTSSPSEATPVLQGALRRAG